MVATSLPITRITIIITSIASHIIIVIITLMTFTDLTLFSTILIAAGATSSTGPGTTTV